MSKLTSLLFVVVLAFATSVQLKKKTQTRHETPELIYNERVPIKDFTFDSKEPTILPQFTRTFECDHSYPVAMVRLNIPFTGNEKEKGRGKFILYLDGEMVDNKMFNHESTYDSNPMDLFGFVENLKPGKHEITLQVASATLIHVPYVNPKTWDEVKLENFPPQLYTMYQVVGFY